MLGHLKSITKSEESALSEVVPGLQGDWHFKRREEQMGIIPQQNFGRKESLRELENIQV